MHIHLGAASLNTTPKDWDRNSQLIVDAIAEARDRGVTLLCLPELAITGYGCDDEFHAPYVSELALRILQDTVIPATEGIAVAVGLPVAYSGATFNAIAVVANRNLIGIVAKKHLAGDGIHYEPRFFKPWPANTVATIPVGTSLVPIGDLLFDFGGVLVGLEVCEDAWVAQRPGMQLAQQAADVILNPSASHFSFGKRAIRHRFVLEGSRAFHCAYVYANLIGNEAGRAIYDGECLIATEGAFVAGSQPFVYQDMVLVDAVVDIARNRVNRNRQASYQPGIGLGTRLHAGDMVLRTKAQPSAPIEALATFSNHEAFARAVALGLFDYLRKTRTRGFAISLSGGADSSACLTLVWFMAKTLLEHAPDHPYLIARFGNARPTLEALMADVCLCVYQATDNSSEATETAARELAQQSGARFERIDVQPLVTAYEALLSNHLKRPLNWETDDIARQNIQARCRAPGIWALTNANNFLLLTTSNRSEAAVGYCTMDGDTAGSLAPIAGIDKAFLKKWLRWAETHYLPALKRVNALQPTAELRPETAHQTDEADLMPYPVLNRIQKLAVVKKLSPKSIFDCLCDEYPSETPSTLFRWLQRYFQLWSRNQWKRERYAPSFHVDDENLDPRSWCRYPILSGGYQRELRELAHEVGIDA